MIYIILSLLTTSILPAEPPVSISVTMTTGYSTGHGTTKMSALADAVRHMPKGATRTAQVEFIQTHRRLWVCIVKWVKH